MQRMGANMKKTKLTKVPAKTERPALGKRILAQVRIRVAERMMAIRECVKVPAMHEDHLEACIFNCIVQTYQDTKKGHFFGKKKKIRASKRLIKSGAVG